MKPVKKKKKKIEIEDVMESVEILKSSIEKENEKIFGKEGNKSLLAYQKKDETVNLEEILKEIEDLKKQFRKENFGNNQEKFPSSPK